MHPHRRIKHTLALMGLTVALIAVPTTAGAMPAAGTTLSDHTVTAGLKPGLCKIGCV